MSKTKGYIIDRGLSPIDQQPFVVIMTMESSNIKTGNMCQVWILREDIHPVEALQTGADYSICGNCPHRYKLVDGKLIRSCYVNVGQAPSTVWKSYKRGIYVDLTDPEIIADTNLTVLLNSRKIRWGAYGDPAIINPDVVKEFNLYAAGHTGYTHQWREDFAQAFVGVFQASCDGMRDYLEASAHGWKTFAVVPKGKEAFSGKQCPATVDGSSAQCRTCALCDGAKQDVFVVAHGTGARHFAGVK